MEEESERESTWRRNEEGGEWREGGREKASERASEQGTEINGERPRNEGG
jgi:hypothetical protein